MSFCRIHFNRFILFLFITGVLLVGRLPSFAQQQEIASAPRVDRLRILWKYCSYNFISDRDSQTVRAYFNSIGRLADSLSDKQLQAYVQYFTLCSRILFSLDYEMHFKKGDYQTVIKAFVAAGKQAIQNGYPDIVASTEHYIGQVYFRVGLYGQAFEHLLKADMMMRNEGYENIPAVSVYLYQLGLDYYRFEDFDKALPCFLEAIRHPVYLPRNEMNSLNAIGLIYAKRKDYAHAIDYYQQTINRAKVYKDTALIGIASGNMGSVYLAQGNNTQALQYYQQNYALNSKREDGRNDAALCALYMAKAFARLHQADSAFSYLKKGHDLQTIIDTTEWLHFYKTYLEASIEANKQKGDLVQTLQLADSLLDFKDSVKERLNAKFLNRAVQKTEAERNLAELQLLESRRKVSQLRLLLVIGMLVITIAVLLLIFKNYRRRKAAQELVAEKERQLLHLEKLRTEESLQHASEQLQTYLATIREKNEYIELLDTEMASLKETGDKESQSSIMDSLLSNTILTDEDWRRFRGLFEQVYPGFTSRLASKFANLSPAETRLLILSRLELSSREMANMLGISVDAIRKSRYRLRKKINLDEDTELSAVIRDL